VKVVVTSVDIKAKRIGLSMKSAPEIGEAVRGGRSAQQPRPQKNTPPSPKEKSGGMGQLGEALAKALRK
jgi:protein Tex